MFKPIEVKALPNYRLWLRYEDGAAGEIDLAHLVGKGVFKLWNDLQAFKRSISANTAPSRGAKKLTSVRTRSISN